MHQRRILAQILLILSILNSVLAAPIVHVREMPKARGALAFRVAREGMAAVLEKRPFEPDWETSAGPSTGHPEIQPYTQAGSSTGHPEIQPDSQAGPSTEHTGAQWDSSSPASPEHPLIQPYTSPPTSPEHGAIQPYTSPPASPQHGAIQPYTPPPASPAHDEIQPHTSPPASPAHDEPQAMTIPPQPVNKAKAPSKAAWRQKIMTPEKIKATKYIAGAALLASAYMGLLFPEIMHGDNTTQS